MARELGDRACEARCLAHRASIRSVGYGQLVETTPDAEEALRLAREIGDPKLVAEALVSLGRVLQWRAVFDRSLGYLQEGVDFARHTHAGFLFGNAAFCIGNAYTAQGAYEDALQWYQQLSDYASRRDTMPFGSHGSPTWWAASILSYSISTKRSGSTWRGTRWRSSIRSWPEPRGHSLVKAGLAHLYRGEHGPAEACFRRAEALLEADTWLRWRWHIALLHACGELALAQGRHDAGLDLRHASPWQLATQTDSRKHVARAQRLQGDILAASGRLAGGGADVGDLGPSAEQIQTPREVWLGQAALGKVLAQLGRDQEAEAQLTQATQTIEAIAAHLQTALAPQLPQGRPGPGGLCGLGPPATAGHALTATGGQHANDARDLCLCCPSKTPQRHAGEGWGRGNGKATGRSVLRAMTCTPLFGRRATAASRCAFPCPGSWRQMQGPRRGKKRR